MVKQVPVLIREIKVQDSTAIAALTSQLGYTTTVALTTRLITDLKNRTADLGLVAVKEGVVVGWLHAFEALRLESGYFIEIGGLVVDGLHRGQGIGKMLIQEVKQWSRQRQVTTIIVRCNTHRLASHRFYLGNGFAEVKEQKVFKLED